MSHGCRYYDEDDKIYRVVAPGPGNYKDNYYRRDKEEARRIAETVRVPMDRNVFVWCIHLGAEDPDESTHRIGLYSPIQGEWSEYSKV